MSSVDVVICITLQKPRLNTHRRKLFPKLVAEMATVENHDTEMVTDIPTCDVDNAESCKLVNQKKNGLTLTVADVADRGSSLQM